MSQLTIELIAAVGNLVATIISSVLTSKDLTKEQQKEALDLLKSNLENKLAKIEAVQFR